MSFSIYILLSFLLINLSSSFEVKCHFFVADGLYFTHKVGGKPEIKTNIINNKVQVDFEVGIYERVILFFKRELGSGTYVRQVRGNITIDGRFYNIEDFARLDWVNQTNFEIYNDHILFPIRDSDEHIIFTIEGEEFLCNLGFNSKRYSCASPTLNVMSNTRLSIPIGNNIRPLSNSIPAFSQDDIVNIAYYPTDNVELTQRGYPLTNNILSNWLSTPFEFIYKGDRTYLQTITYSVYRDKCVEKDCVEGVITIEVCGQNCQSCSSNGGVYGCQKCKEGYAFKDATKECVLITSYGDHYVDNGGYLQQCSSQCNSCTNTAENDNHHCLECKDGYYKYKVPNTNTEYSCFATQEDSYYLVNGTTDNEITLCEASDGFKYENGKICLSQCKPYNPYYQIQNTNECIDECHTHSTSNIYSGDDKYCVESCTEHDGFPFQYTDTEGKQRCSETCDKFVKIENGNKICTADCGPGYYVHIDTKQCIDNCNITDPITHEQYLHQQGDTLICTGSCFGEYKYYLESFNRCVKNCVDYNKKIDSENMKCVDTCTSPYQAYIQNKTCVITCPTTTPFINEQQECVDTCPSYIHGNKKHCVDSCENTESKYISSSNIKQCVYECELNEKLSGNQCVKNCEGQTPFEYEQGKLCLHKCEDKNYYQYKHNKCLLECGDYLYKYEYTTDTGVVVKKCLTQCEQPLPYMFNDNMTCLSSCPDNYLIYPSPETCVTSCYGSYPYEEGSSCVSQCTLDKVIHNNKCEDKCPNGMYIDVNGVNCVNECLIPNNYIIDNKCSNSCNDIHQFYYKEDNNCYIQCNVVLSQVTNMPLYTIKDDVNGIKLCVDECVYPYIYELTRSGEKYCVAQCKDIVSLNGVDHMYVSSNGKECVSECNDGEYIYNDEQCVLQCKGKFQYYDVQLHVCVEYCKEEQFVEFENKKCYDICPSDKKVIHIEGRKECFDGECPLEFKYHRDNVCLRSCEDIYLYSFENECVTEDECMGYIVIEEKLCLTNCEGKYSYLNTVNDHCVEKCPSNLFVSNDKKCLSVCPNEEKFYLNNPKQCVVSCSETKFPFVSADNNECVNECQSEDKFAIGNDMHYCLNGCSGEFKYEYGNTSQCVKECEGVFQFENGMKCVDKCEGVNYMEYNKKCVSSCDGLFVVGSPEKCVDSCPYSYPFVSISGKCVTQCDAPNSKFYEDNGKQYCTNICPNNEPSVAATGQCVSSCPNDHPYLQEGFNTCVQSCFEPVPYLDLVNKKCVYECDIRNTFKVEDDKMCVEECDDGYYTVPVLKKCVKDCSKVSGYEYEDKVGKKCLSDCSFASGENKLHYQKSCVDKCPQFTKPNGNTCKFDLDFIDQTEDFLITSKEKDSVIKDLEHVIVDISKVGETIKGDDFILQAYPSDKPLKGNAYTSSLNFTACELTLREKGIVGEDEEIIIVKFDYLDETAITNQVEYKVYDTDGNEIDISVCEDEDVYISYPLYNEEKINYSLGYSMNENYNIDIYDPNSELYMDLCYPFQINKTDVLLSDRKKYFYLNISLCPDNCIYIGINYTTKAADCKCKTKTLFSSLKNKPMKNILPIDPHFLEDQTPTNINVLLCYNLLTKRECIINNISFWICSFLLLMTIIIQLIGGCIEKKKLYQKIFTFIHSNPPKNTSTSNFNNSQKSDAKYGKEKQYLESDPQPPPKNNTIPQQHTENLNNSIPNNTNNTNNNNNTNNINSFTNNHSISYSNDNFSSNSLSQRQFILPEQEFINSSDKAKEKESQYRCIILSSPKLTYSDKPYNDYVHNNSNNNNNKKHLSSNEKLVSYPLLKQHKIDQYPFINAIEHDTRSCCEVYSSYLQEQLLLLRLFYIKSHFDLISFQILNYITFFNLSAFFNGILFFNKYIHYRFINCGKIHLNKTFINSVASCIVAAVLLHLLNKLTAYKQIIESMFNEIKNREEREDCGNKAIRYFNKKTIVFHFVVFVVMAFCWYYLTLLNCVYKGSQVDWVICVIGSLVLEIIGGLGYVGVVAGLRTKGLRKMKKEMYNVSIFLREIACYY